MRNMPGTSGLVSDSIRLGEGTLGELRAPRLAGFYGRDVDNLNASYDEGDQIVKIYELLGAPPAAMIQSGTKGLKHFKRNEGDTGYTLRDPPRPPRCQHLEGA